jgi:glutathione S-transferase
MLRILGRSSSINVRKVLWTCDEIGLAYEREDWGAGSRSTREPSFLALNPNAQVPVIEDDGFVLWESSTICRYLASKHRRTDLLPAEAAARARVEQWMDWQATELNPSWRYPFYAVVRKDPAFTDDGQLKAGIEHWNREMRILDRQLAATGAYAAGAFFSLADIVLGLSVHRWLRTPIAHAPCPAVTAYYDRLRGRPAFPPHAREDVP